MYEKPLNKIFFDKCGQLNKHGRWNTYKKTINVDRGFLCGHETNVWKTINVDRGFLCGHETNVWKTINVDPCLFDIEE